MSTIFRENFHDKVAASRYFCEYSLKQATDIHPNLTIIIKHDATAAVNTATDTTDDLLEWQ